MSHSAANIVLVMDIFIANYFFIFMKFHTRWTQGAKILHLGLKPVAAIK